MFVAVSSTGTGDRVMYSEDGITWTIGVAPDANQWTAVAYAPELGLFVAVGAVTGTGDRVMTSVSAFSFPYREAP
jgi:hypothetical protein